MYPVELRKFATTLHFYSPRAYNYVRKTFNFCLPDVSTIRKWTSSIDCMPGFSQFCFNTLKGKADV